MRSLIYRAFSVTALVATSFPAFGADQYAKITALEIAQLPKFCYRQLQVPNATGDEFRIRDCGPGMNHYCWGLVDIIRAKATVGNKSAKMGHLGRAAGNIRYTENAMKDYPSCPIREHVAASKAQVLNLQKMYGGQPTVPR